jgi:membrane protease YdiL (CAAX protease family)
MTTPQEQFSAFQPRKTWQHISNFPLVRILIAIVFLVPVVLIHNTIVRFAKEMFEQSSYEWFKDVWWLVDIAIFILAYYFYTRLVEKRPAREFFTSGAVPETGFGVAIGAILVSATVGIMFMARSYTVDSLGSWETFVHLLRQFGVDAFMEELVFRIIVFRLLEEWLGSLWGFVIASSICSLAHMGNPHSTVWTTVSISALSVLLTASFLLTRRIWLAWGVHFGWNYFQTAVFGMANSGRSDHVTFITPRITGPEWLTGGAFGIEASWLAFAIVTVTAVIIIRIAVQRGQVVKPQWRR